MKVRYNEDEAYPVYFETDVTYITEIEVTEEENTRWKKLDKDFWAMQGEIDRRVTAARQAARG